MHLSSALNAIEKRGTFKAYKEAQEEYVEQCNMAKQAKAALALLTAPSSRGKKAPEKAPAKKSSKREKAFQKIKENPALANAPAPEICNEFKAIYDKASSTRETTKNKRKAAVTEMFQFYAILLTSFKDE
jgi:hypothetical protein